MSVEASRLSKGETFFEHGARLLSSSEGNDAVLELIGDILTLAGEIASQSKSAPNASKGIEAARDWVETTRDALSMFNLFRGVFPDLIQHAKKTHRLITKNEWSKINVLKLGKHASGILAKGICIIAFGLVKPVINIQKHIFSKIDKSLAAGGIEKAADLVFLLLHISSLIHSFFHLAHLSTQVNTQKEKLFRKVTDCILSILATLFELTSHLIEMCRPSSPAWVHIPFTLGAALIGVVRIWIDTA